MNIKYVHTNIIAKDWEGLAKFYIEVFNCKPLYPKRDLTGNWVEKLTNLNEVRIKGIHLSLPGYENGPTLEIFQYTPENLRNGTPFINQQGFGHIAFHVDDVEEVLSKVINHGGSKLGDMICQEMHGIGILSVVYAADPEGNFIEIQNWKK